MNRKTIKSVLKQLDRIPLPDKETILAACAAQELHVGQAEPKPKRRPHLKPVLASLVALGVLLSGATVYAAIAEARDYAAAVTFFNTNNLPLDGLSRSEIKHVYRDISTGTFTFGKTADVVTSSVSGYDLFQEEPTPEDLAKLWQAKNGNHTWPAFLPGQDDGVTYRISYTERLDEKLGFNVTDQSVIQKWVDGQQVWEASFKNLWLDSYAVLGDSVIVYGQTPTWSSEQTQYAWLALVDASGQIRWQHVMDNGFKHEYIGAVLPDEDGLAVFSRGNLKVLCLSRFDRTGQRTHFSQTEVGSYGIRNAARLADGYLVQLLDYAQGDRLIKMTRDGTLADAYTYGSEDENYYIADMAEFAGKICLSAYAVPRMADDMPHTSHYEIGPVLEEIYAGKDFEISNEALTQKVRDNYTALLLICDPISGEPQVFYSVAGSLGAALSVNENGELVWEVESITDTFLSMATSSFTIGGASTVYRYTFDAAGTLLSQEKTEIAAPFRK